LHAASVRDALRGITAKKITASFVMPAYLKILLYLVTVFVVGALVAPPVFWLGQWLEAAGLSVWLAGFPFHRVLSRCIQVSALVLLWPTLRWVGLRRPAELNLQPNPSWRSDLVAGVAMASGLVAMLAVFYVAGGFAHLRPEPAWSGLVRILLTAAAVSGIEEVVFRGVVLGLCLWSLPRAGAIFVSTLFFVVVHFIKPSKTAMAPEAVGWSSGLAEALRFREGLPEGGLLIFGAASLFVAGWILGAAAVRTRSLWLPIGLHAGWIFSQQTSNLFLQTASASPSGHLPWVGPSLVSGAVPTGILPLGVLVLTGLLVQLYLRYVFRPVAPGGS
jgi:membrane protease YdiL (CAAX protease family)